MSKEALTRAASLCGGFASLAEKLGASPQAVSNWKTRGIPIEHCTAIEQAANGEVTRRDLRPDDWHRIWPELVSAQHPAPAEPAKAPA